MNKKSPFAEIPIHPDNWLPSPNTQAEFEEWILKTTQALKAWLEATQSNFIRENEVVKAFDALNDRIAGAWAKHEPKTDVQTGTMERKDKQRMRAAMKTLKNEKDKFHKLHRTWYWHVERKHAHMAWEDFLYYQNVWNRRYLDPSKTFYLTAREREGEAYS